jgi:hypothetical protein
VDMGLEETDDDIDYNYHPSSPYSASTPLSLEDIQFMLSLTPRNFKKNQSNRWLKRAIKNSIQLFLSEFDVADISWGRWEEFFWVDRISMRHSEDRVAGQFFSS